MDKLVRMIEKYGIPARDLYDIPTSGATFPDGAHYRMEISGIHTIAEMEALVDEMNKRDIPVHRVIAFGQGANRLTEKELRDFAQIGQDAGIEIIAIPSARADYDIGKHAQTDWGRYSGVRVRGSDNLLYLVAGIQRCIEAGIKGFLLYGEDALFLLNQMRENGDLPKDIIFKVSYTAGHSNPAGAKLLENLGADSFNPVTDLTLPMLAALRKVIKMPLDIVTVSYEALGNINRFWEGPEIVRVSSPCYLKQELTGPPEAAREKVKYCQIMRELIERLHPELKLSKQRPEDLRVPEPPKG